MPTAFVTGGTGFLGLNIVQLLKEEGWHVIAMHRRSSSTDRLQKLGAELRPAELGDVESLKAAIPDDVDAVFHVAGDVSWWNQHRDRQEQVNVIGTRHVVNAAIAKKAKRFVHTSSGAAYGVRSGVVDETMESFAPGSPLGYVRTKWLSEVEVKKGIASGLAAVIMNPGNIIGPFDTTGWGRMFRLIKKGKLPSVAPGSASFCHSREVARAHLAAVTKGRVGENYLLGGADAKYAELTAIIAELFGTKPPKPAPSLLLRAIGRVADWTSILTKKEPGMTAGMADFLCLSWRMDCSKAERELGYQPASLRKMTEDAAAWLKSEAMV